MTSEGDLRKCYGNMLELLYSGSNHLRARRGLQKVVPEKVLWKCSRAVGQRFKAFESKGLQQVTSEGAMELLQSGDSAVKKMFKERTLEGGT